MPDHETIYDQHPGEYEELVSREDYQGNLLPAIEKIIDLDGIDVVESGAGTGRLTRLYAPKVKSVLACDIAPAMLNHGKELNRLSGLDNIEYKVADHRDLPGKDKSADLVISGWSVSYFASWNVDRWQEQTKKTIDEMMRILRPGGTVLIIETLGTGSETPKAPTESLEKYYAFIEGLGFKRSWIRTDYSFDSLEESEKIAGYFFGKEMKELIRKNKWQVLPECTGFWSLKKI